MDAVRRWRLYTISPIDFGWDHLQTVEETFNRLQKVCAWDFHHLRIFMGDYTNALSIVMRVGNPGTWAEWPRVFWIPGPDGDGEWHYGFAFKDSNNGTTHVVTPYELRWMGVNPVVLSERRA